MALRFDTESEIVTKIKVIGVGGGGNNTVDRMIDANLQGAEFIAVNTDRQQLNRSKASWRVQIGERTSAGHGCGAKPSLGRKCAEEDREALTEILRDTDMVFITAGMGGGTGTGAAPVIAEIAQEMGILTVGVVTRPFKFEGGRRAAQAEEGIRELSGHVDSLVIIPNERLKYVTDQKITFVNAFAYADEVLKQAIASIYELIISEGIINLDFADVYSIMKDSGFAHMGVGRAAGRDKASVAATMAIQSPLLETSIRGAKGVLINIVGSPEIELGEIETAADYVKENADPEAQIIFGAAIDPTLNDEMRVTIIATGFETNSPNPLNGPAKDSKAEAPAEKPAPEASIADEELPFVESEPKYVSRSAASAASSASNPVNEEYERLLKMLTEQ
ncbi:MAG: cell division protein FtsZ [Clostridiales bacterium]|nr:cell division protein FtsZ [Clostridiales bacterium]